MLVQESFTIFPIYTIEQKRLSDYDYQTGNFFSGIGLLIIGPMTWENFKNSTSKLKRQKHGAVTQRLWFNFQAGLTWQDGHFKQ